MHISPQCCLHDAASGAKDGASASPNAKELIKLLRRQVAIIPAALLHQRCQVTSCDNVVNFPADPKAGWCAHNLVVATGPSALLATELLVLALL